MIIGNSDRVRMKDHHSLSGMLNLYQDLLGQDVLTSFAADRGYASQDNRNTLKEEEVSKTSACRLNLQNNRIRPQPRSTNQIAK